MASGITGGSGTAGRARTVLLALLAALLLVAVVVRDGVGPVAPSGLRSRQAVQGRIESLSRIVASRDIIGELYSSLDVPFALRFAGVETYATGEKIGPAGAERLVRKHLAELGPVQALAIVAAPGQVETLGEGITRAVFDVSFTAVNERQAMEAAAQFARPESGLVWESFTAISDPRGHKVMVSGRVLALLVEPVE